LNFHSFSGLLLIYLFFLVDTFPDALANFFHEVLA